MHIVTAFIRGIPITPDPLAGATGASAPVTIRLLARNTVPADHQEDFVLPYNPVQIRYGGLSDEIAQIPRPGRAPIVAFKSHRLMTLDFTFVVAHPGDGLIRPVDDEIRILRRFASSSNRAVQLIGFDGVTNTPTQFRNQDNVYSALLFTIVDFSVESIRRNKKNEITQATCTISLIENRNPNITRVVINALQPSKMTIPCAKKGYARKKKGRCLPPKGSIPDPIPEKCADAVCRTNKNIKRTNLARPGLSPSRKR